MLSRSSFRVELTTCMTISYPAKLAEYIPKDECCKIAAFICFRSSPWCCRYLGSDGLRMGGCSVPPGKGMPEPQAFLFFSSVGLGNFTLCALGRDVQLSSYQSKKTPAVLAESKLQKEASSPP